MKFVRHVVATRQGGVTELLSTTTGLSKSAVKQCLNKGAVWLRSSGKKEQRLRKASFQVQIDDRLSLYYDDGILQRTVPEPLCLYSEKQYSIWIKPAGMLSQGTRYGDHCSLLRHVEKTAAARSTIHLVHRLDREAQGLVLFAHSRSSAARFSELFRNGGMEKHYDAITEGLLAGENESICISDPLDGKPACTLVTVVRHDRSRQCSHLDINLKTGRYHQIRRHLSAMGHPLIGDLRYGGKHNAAGLHLTARSLAFRCPFSGRNREFRLPESPDFSPSERD